MSEKGTSSTEKADKVENQQGMSGFMSSVFGSSSNSKNNDQSAGGETAIDFGEIQGFVNDDGNTAGNNASGKMSLTVASPAVRYGYFFVVFLLSIT